MSDAKLSTQNAILVHLARAGENPRDFRLHEGATLGDLLRLAGEASTGPPILVDGTPVEDALMLREGAVVTLPKPPWKAKIEAFENEELFQEYMEILKANRGSLVPDEDLGE